MKQKNKNRRVMRVLPLTLLNPWNQKEGDESITSHPSETWNQKEGDESITSHPNETWNQHESWQTTNIWCMMKVLDKKHVICSWNLQGFLHFFIFLIFMGFLPSWFFAGGAGRAIKSKFERWTLVMRVLPHFYFFFKHDITVTANKHHSKGSTPNCM